jgi:coenzyme PQQ biosynthesis protein PqqD
VNSDNVRPFCERPLNEHGVMRCPLLVRHARYRWDQLRQQHQLVYPEGILVLNDTGAAVVRLCDGRALAEIHAALAEAFSEPSSDHVNEFLQQLYQKGLLRDAAS